MIISTQSFVITALFKNHNYGQVCIWCFRTASQLVPGMHLVLWIDHSSQSHHVVLKPRGMMRSLLSNGKHSWDSQLLGFRNQPQYKLIFKMCFPVMMSLLFLGMGLFKQKSRVLLALCRWRRKSTWISKKKLLYTSTQRGCLGMSAFAQCRTWRDLTSKRRWRSGHTSCTSTETLRVPLGLVWGPGYHDQMQNVLLEKTWLNRKSRTGQNGSTKDL